MENEVNIYEMWVAYCEFTKALGYMEGMMHRDWYDAFPHIIYPCCSTPRGEIRE